MKQKSFFVVLMIAHVCSSAPQETPRQPELVSSVVNNYQKYEYDYVMTGIVESVSYAASGLYPCYVAIDDPTSPGNLYYHAAVLQSMCEFAENCKNQNTVVKMGVQKAWIGANNILTIEYNNTRAIYW